MTYSNESSVSVNEIIASAQLRLQDKDGHKFTPGWYVSKTQRALSELSFDTMFFEITKDVEFPSESLSIDVPANCFNLKEVYAMTVSDTNAIMNIHNVYFKRQYKTNGVGKGYSATQTSMSKNEEPYVDIIGASTDVFTPQQIVSENSMYYYSVNNGRIQFSSNCSSFNRVRLVFNGTHTPLGDIPLVPEIFQAVVEDYVVEQGMQILKAEDPKKWRPLWSDVYETLYNPRNGAWAKAERRAKKLDHKSRKDFLMYQQKANA